MAGSKGLYAPLAAELAATRAQIDAIIASPGLVGINRKSGAASVAAIVDDYTRAIARVLAADNPDFDYQRFMRAAGAIR